MLIIHRIGSFEPLHYAISTEKKSICFPYMGVFLIDSSDLNKQYKQNKFLRQAVLVSGEFVPLE